MNAPQIAVLVAFWRLQAEILPPPFQTMKSPSKESPVSYLIFEIKKIEIEKVEIKKIEIEKVEIKKIG